MFRSVLEDLEQKVDGTLAVSLIGVDGIPIESVNRGQFPLDPLGAELSSLLKTLRTARTDLDTGDIEQFVMTTQKHITFVSKVTEDYFILMVLGREANYGRARFELRRARFALQDELL